jgi:hypothetical protein
MKNRLYAASMLLLSIVLAASAWNGAGAVRQWVAAPATAQAAGRPTERDVPVRAPAGSALAQIAVAERAVVFVFSPDCAVSRANTANWTELVRRARGGGVALFAVGPTSPDSAAAYWGALARHVRVLTATPEQIDAVLGVRATPVTLTIEKGRIRTETPGPLRSAARAELMEFVGERNVD